MDYFDFVRSVARGQAQAVKQNWPRVRPCPICARESFAMHMDEDGAQEFICPVGHRAVVVHGHVVVIQHGPV
jgi:hypothetical protein